MREFFNAGKHFELQLARDAQAGDADIRDGVFDCFVDILFLPAIDAGEQMQGAGAHADVRTFPQLDQFFFSIPLHFMQPRPGPVTSGLVRRLQSGDATGRSIKFEPRGESLAPSRGNTIDAAGHRLQLLISHIVPTHPGVIPIGNVDRTVRRDAHVRGQEPSIFGAQNIFDFRAVPGAVRLDGISPDHARSGVTVNDLVVEDLGEQIASNLGPL